MVDYISFSDIICQEILKMKKEKPERVIVIGGGLSGLTAAHCILKQQPTTQVTLLQANDYLGGRTKSININGCNFDLGGAFIGPTQHHSIQLAIQSKNELVNVNSKGKKIIQFKNEIGTYSSTIPDKVNIIALLQMQWTIWKIDRMAQKVSSLDPKDCQLGNYWDSVTVKSWLDDNISFTKIKVMIEAAIRVILGVQLSQVSMLYLLYYIRQSQSFQNLINVQNGLQQKKTSKGSQHMSIYLGDQIKTKGGSIKLNYYVKQIIQKESSCLVIGQDETNIQADYIIIAAPPCSAGKIHFQPPLSNQRKLLCDRSFMGILIKVIVLYKKQYWLQKGFSGQTLSDCFDSPVMNGFDDSRVGQNGQLQPALSIFVGGGVIRYWMNRQDFKDVLLRKLAQYYKEPEMLNPLHITWHDWHDSKYIRGGPVSPFYPGTLSQIDDLRKPEGRIHWAGTQMATVSTGFMDGAIQSGKRAAKEVLNLFQGSGDKKDEKETTNVNKKVSKDYPYTRTTYKKSKYFEWW